MTDYDSFSVFGWMQNQYGLHGAELIAFAVIFKQTQARGCLWPINIEEISEKADCSLRSAELALENLERKNLIEKVPYVWGEDGDMAYHVNYDI